MGPRAPCTTSRPMSTSGEREIPHGAEALPGRRRPDDGELGAAHARTGPHPLRTRPRRRRSHVAHAVRHFHAAGDVAGLTLTLYDLSVDRRAGGRPRAGRPAARRRDATSRTRPARRSRVLTENAFEDARRAAERPRADVRGRRRAARRRGRGDDPGRGRSPTPSRAPPPDEDDDHDLRPSRAGRSRS